MTAPVRMVGINHVALEVGEIEEALAWYGRFLAFGIRGRSPRMAFLDLGDQFIALSAGRVQARDGARHFGLVVDDKETLRKELLDAGVEVSRSGFVDFEDPWGNHIQAVDYRDIQFTKTAAVLDAMGLEGLQKSEAALAELHAKGIETAS